MRYKGFELLLTAALLYEKTKTYKLNAIASLTGLKRTALSEFLRSWYLGKTKLSILQNWLLPSNLSIDSLVKEFINIYDEFIEGEIIYLLSFPRFNETMGEIDERIKHLSPAKRGEIYSIIIRILMNKNRVHNVTSERESSWSQEFPKVPGYYWVKTQFGIDMWFLYEENGEIYYKPFGNSRNPISAKFEFYGPIFPPK